METLEMAALISAWLWASGGYCPIELDQQGRFVRSLSLDSLNSLGLPRAPNPQIH